MTISGTVRVQQAQTQPRYIAYVATTAEEVLESQKLRYEVFANEMGADLGVTADGLDKDDFDQHCKHVLVRESETGRLVGSTRLLSREGAKLAGGFYSETEFDITSIYSLPGSIVEIGRTCVHADFRTGAVIATLWQALGAYILAEKTDYLIGCASIEWGTDGSMIHAVTRKLSQRFMAPEHLHVIPRVKVPNPDSEGKVEAIKIPPLMKAYVSLGARICGEPCWDEAFGVADLFVLLDTKDLSKRYARHFLDRQRS